MLEINSAGLKSLIGKTVTLFCANFFYRGELISVNDAEVLLKDPGIVYETGAWTDKKYADLQPLNVDQLYVRTAFIESYGVVK